MNLKTISFALLTLCLLPSARLCAQAADDNPTGPAGMFNGNVTTAGFLDPYTGNAMRNVTDVILSGAVGDYPLAFTRIANSRNSPRNAGFAFAGGWRHSYAWSMTDEPIVYSTAGTPPTSYTVNYPDGRVITFEEPAAGSPADNAGETYFRGPIGLSERFQPLNLTTNLAYLVMVDGGRVEFKATETNAGTYFYRDYVAQAIIDPHGLRTELTYNTDGTLHRMTEPAGRYLELTWESIPNGFYSESVIEKVTASDGREVTYDYGNDNFYPGTTTYNYLSSVHYYDDPGTGGAVYTYKAPNTPDAFGQYDGTPLLAFCTDPLYPRAMRNIAYDYLPNGTDVVHGQILSEKPGPADPAVTTIAYGYEIRTETRGDGPTRDINYAAYPYIGHLLFGVTDFNGDTDSLFGYDYSNYRSAYTDGNGSYTQMIREPITGRLTSLTHPPDKNNVQSSVSYVYTDPLNPYYLDHRTDELNHTIAYTRDSLHRVTRIDYPDSAYETFTYNAFNQVLVHRLTSGGIETSVYDTRGLKQTFTNADNQTTTYTYDALDRLASMQEPLGYVTDYEYNSRGQLTKTTFPPDPVTSVRYTKVNTYDLIGMLTATTDELGHTTNYVYDDFRRLLTTTNPLSETVTNSYLPWGQTSSYLTTSRFVFSVTAPSGKKVYHYADNEFRLTKETQAPGTADEAIRNFTYDPVGNRLTAQDARGNTTSFEFDQRNRLITTTEPLSHVTSYDYDQASNKIKETRPDNKFRTWDTFDPLNRVTHMTGFLSDPTSYLYDFAGNRTQMTDSKGAVYSFGFDAMNRKISATYPADAGGALRSETWTYDANSNLATYINPAGQTNAFTYDNRNRLVANDWNAFGPDVTRTYDAASRLISVSTTDSVVSFAYDDANRQTSEDQSLTGQPLRHITTPVDVDGNRASLSLAGVYTLYYDYTQRQQLAHIRDSATLGSGEWFEYTYNLNGSMTKRQNVFQGLDSTNFSYDALNRVTQLEQTGLNDVNFATSHYEYDLVNNIQDTYRDEQAGKGERFGYDDANQLISAVYNADGVQTPNPTNATRTVGYTLTPLNRLSLTDNGALTNYTADGMNQYTQVTGLASLYDSNFNQRKLGGWLYTYDAARRLTKAANASTGSSVEFGYDGLNRVTKRVTNGVAKVYTYDGWKQIAEWNGNGNSLLTWNLYGPGPDELLLRRASTTNYLHYHSDQFGSVKFLLDQNAVGIEKYTYDAFGAPTITSWTGQPRTESAYGNRFMFTGREYLAPTGLYDYRNRIYSPVIGRFLQTDPTGFDAGDNNLFRYVGHNPVSRTDSNGLFQFTFAGGDELGGYVTFGYNGRQFNFAGYIGAGGGFLFNLNPYDSGSHDAGSFAGYIATGGEGAGYFSVDLTGYGGGDGHYTTLEGSAFNYTSGVDLDALTPTQGSVSLGEGAFIGVGASHYNTPGSPNSPTLIDQVGQAVQGFFDWIFGDGGDSGAGATGTGSSSAGGSFGGSGGVSANGFTGSVSGYGPGGPSAGSITGSLLGDLEANAPSNNKDH